MNSMKNIFLISEDSRGNIKKLLKMSDQLADHFNEQDPKNAFALAKCFVIWLRNEYVADFGGVNDPARMAVRGDEEIKKRLEKVDKPTMEQFWRELGNGIKKMLKDKPQYQAQLNQAKTIEDIRKVQGDYFKKTNKNTDRILMTHEDGWYWLKLDPDEYKEEGLTMQHCATDARGNLVSLRDPQNLPHITMTYNFGNDRVYQIKGKQNKPPDRKYWGYLIDFWKEKRPILRDWELMDGRTRVGKEVSELGKILSELSPPDAALMKILGELEGTMKDPVIRKWVWDVDVLSHGIGGYGNDDVTAAIDQIKKFFERSGFTKIKLKLKTETREIFYDPNFWTNEAQPMPPPYEQLNTFNAWVVANMAKMGLWSTELSHDPNGWVLANADTLQNLMSKLHKASGITHPKPISVRSLAGAGAHKSLHKITQDIYADWFPQTRAKTEQEWATAKDFFAEHADIWSGIERFLKSYQHLGMEMQEKYAEKFASAQKIYKDSKNRFMMPVNDGSLYEIKGIVLTGTNGFYLARVK